MNFAFLCVGVIKPYWRGELWTFPVIFMARFLLGIQLQHDVCHACTSKHQIVNDVLSVVASLFGGFKSWNWALWHDVGHHIHVNIMDFDITFKGKETVKKLSRGNGWVFYFLAFTMTSEVTPLLEIPLWLNLSTKVTKNVHLAHLGLRDWLIPSLAELIFRYVFLIHPCWYLGVSYGLTYSLIIHTVCVGGQALIVFPSHPGEPPEPPTKVLTNLKKFKIKKVFAMKCIIFFVIELGVAPNLRLR